MNKNHSASIYIFPLNNADVCLMLWRCYAPKRPSIRRFPPVCELDFCWWQSQFFFFWQMPNCKERWKIADVTTGDSPVFLFLGKFLLSVSKNAQRLLKNFTVNKIWMSDIYNTIKPINKIYFAQFSKRLNRCQNFVVKRLLVKSELFASFNFSNCKGCFADDWHFYRLIFE